ncbi:hypothetical protein BJY00DRAFT_282232 [Aspergillus carlsbadensis]|nr:hypothetical protein BJY00DRAFT_282232 [Aspergillus carlsbadensis]
MLVLYKKIVVAASKTHTGPARLRPNSEVPLMPHRLRYGETAGGLHHAQTLGNITPP